MKADRLSGTVTLAGSAGTPRPSSADSAPKIGSGGEGAPRAVYDVLLDKAIAFFTSLRLTVVLLAFGIILVFLGTIAQVELGLYKAQNAYFRSFFLYWKGIPVFPGGYLVGGILLINLVASHFRRFSLSRDKAGIWMVHAGLILLLLGQLGTDMLSRESSLHLRNGETRNYSEADRQVELAIIDATDPETDKVVAIPQRVLMQQSEISNPDIPFRVRIQKYYANSVVDDRPKDATSPPLVSNGTGTRAIVKEVPHATEMDRRDIPSAIVEILTPQGTLGTWLASEYISAPQPFSYGNRSYQLALRPRRYYKPYSIQLLEFRHDVYPGTDIPKNFSSRVLLQHPEKSEKREVLIYMNNPLRYSGETYYQASFDVDNQGTILQVVHNPSWLTPYFSCILVGLGLVVHFVIHLFGFGSRRKKPLAQGARPASGS